MKLSQDYIQENNLVKLKDCNKNEYDQAIEAIKQVINHNDNKYVDAYFFDQQDYYLIICHCLDIDLYIEKCMVNLYKQLITCHQKPKLRDTKQYLIVITRPLMYLEPIDEDTDLTEMFEVYWNDSLIPPPNLENLSINENADLVVYKYTDYTTIKKGYASCSYNETLCSELLEFYIDMLEILVKNKNIKNIKIVDA